MKVPSLTKKETPAKTPETGVLFKQMPSWWVTLYAFVLVSAFCYFSHLFFTWVPPYLYEVFKNLRGLPTAWADLGLYWSERALDWVVIAAAFYQLFWQIGTRYILTEQEIRIEGWFPMRKVVSIPLGAVRRYGYQQNWLAVLLNFGTIEIDTSGPAPARLPHCPKTKIFLELLKHLVASALQNSTVSPPRNP
jgi:hypothetical protein